ncbi:MAG TPA: glycosyltransferase family 4 protein [Candidatus Eisenbacteria bacterium]|nr:glycosyltransferase family 4 protein [Candidatus Eisenbacteria bacterium]
MLTVAYLANQFPASVEPYVADEIAELQSRGVGVIACSVRRSTESTTMQPVEIVLLPVSISTALSGIWLCISRFTVLGPVLVRIIFRGTEGPWRRLKTLTHTFLGACLAVRLQRSHLQHVHVHHGYFGSWVGMIAAKLMGVGFSFTLHGSDLLLHNTYLGAKLAASDFCLTVSEYNRRFIVARYPCVKDKVFVSRLGVEVPRPSQEEGIWHHDPVTILSVGRLHAVKDHAFLVRACARLVQRNIPFKCLIAGEGPEQRALESQIRWLGLSERVRLLGHVAHESLASLYESAGLVVLTSRSEGIPLVLMEAMALGKIVLAPAITGIPELVIPGKTGFLYQPGSIENFVDQLLFIQSALSTELQVENGGHCTSLSPLPLMRRAARVHVLQNFNRSKNLRIFSNLFLSRIAAREQSVPDENLVLQQI